MREYNLEPECLYGGHGLACVGTGDVRYLCTLNLPYRPVSSLLLLSMLPACVASDLDY